ncbi:uncharacterized protein APUU_40071S [Aspergillus puulaauensis]|uniref:CoA-transferase family III domain-containing protein n=1 Tax=Aspergillus puulaauensis TaxID=1220207 RepID=A0A7R7XM01_9EURO|nr:uncharacterized protein APUU_40071S [Aspergillus puulaauensis]BCS23627.1 hypothetical protein APUU_40071S [Aspergillus puulaauensis]
MAIGSYSVPKAAESLLLEGILQNPVLRHNIPTDASAFAEYTKFSGSDKPSVPINWRFAESISALKGLESLWLNALLKAKDHATLFFMSCLVLDVVGKDGKPENPNLSSMQRALSVFPMNRGESPVYRGAATNIYKTKDGRFYHLHGSMNAVPSLTALDLPLTADYTSEAEASRVIQDRVSQLDSQELDTLMNEEYRQAGTICYSTEEFKHGDHGKHNAQAGLYELRHVPNVNQQPAWWKDSADTGVSRPLAGLKVIDLTRVIAGPSITKGLAELGASVLRVTGPDVVDFVPLHGDLNWGKWNCSLDLKSPKGKKTLQDLIYEADVVLDGYRPGVMERLGFGREAVLGLVKDRPYGLVYARENCYGWHGPWQHRSGWQQISDAVCGVSLEYGRAMGLDEPATPVFPNSDYCTGVIGVSGILNGLLERGQKGGSVYVDIALNYYSQWLVNSVGVYPPVVWEEVWNKHQNLTFRHIQGMGTMIPAMLKSLAQNSGNVLFRPEFFETRHSAAVDRYFKAVRPILNFPGKEVNLCYNVGTRTNGHDAARWPEDLRSEVIV